MHNAWSPVLASIFAGNAVVVKCSEHVVWSTSWFIGAIRECLISCGHDPELVQVCGIAFALVGEILTGPF